MLEECISKLNEQKAEIAAAVRLYLENAKFSLSLLFCLFQKTVHHRPSSFKIFSWSRCDLQLQKMGKKL
jgi:hypothetical protein